MKISCITTPYRQLATSQSFSESPWTSWPIGSSPELLGRPQVDRTRRRDRVRNGALPSSLCTIAGDVAMAAARTLMLHHIGDQIAKLPTEIRDQLQTTGKTESTLRRLQHIKAPSDSTISGQYRLGWLRAFIDQDRAARREIRRLERLIDELLDAHGTTLRDEDGIGPIAAATLICEVGDPFRFDRESKFARWCGTGAVAMSSGEGVGQPVRRLDFRGNRTINSVLYIASITQARDQAEARHYSKGKPPKARPDEPTNATSLTTSSVACGKTKGPDSTKLRSRLNKEACNSPRASAR